MENNRPSELETEKGLHLNFGFRKHNSKTILFYICCPIFAEEIKKNAVSGAQKRSKEIKRKTE